ncbi:hypothetical protein [Enterobacter sp. PTB]|uniref:hypothetical protein n=1 Tax=Enterobacter sp. PTB TaxID=3143437 RepID=UPI003DAA1EAE
MSAPRRTRHTVMKSIRLHYETEQIITILSQQRGESWATCAKKLLLTASREALASAVHNPSDLSQ